METFIELSIIVIITALVSICMRILRQPMVVGYILSGILVGPYMFGVLESYDQIELFSKIGISTLLFIVGLSLSPHVVREVGKVSLITGIGQVLFTSIIGFGICLLLGLSTTESLFVSIAITFSSTIIVMKLLSDRGDVHKLYGRVAVGFLLVQDLIATIILMIVSSVGINTGEYSQITELTLLFLKGILVSTILYLVSRKMLYYISNFLASSQEFLFIFSLAWGFGISSLFYLLGFSIEIGALIAGVALSMSPFAYEIGSKLKPLRDFFILLFFILLGAELAIGDISGLIPAAIILSMFILIGNPIIVFYLMNILGFKTRTSFQAGLTVAQISEFSLILMSLAYSLGFVNKEVLSLITIVGLITIAGSTYLILYSDQIYKYLQSILKQIEIRKRSSEKKDQDSDVYDIVLFGFGRVGIDFVKVFQSLGKKFLVVDFNPKSIQMLQEKEIPYRFGDVEDIEFLEEINIKKSSLVVSTIPDFGSNALLLEYLKEQSGSALTILLSHDVKDANDLYKKGASYVVMPHYLGAEHASHIIKESGFDPDLYKKHRDGHINTIIEKVFI